MKHNKQQKNEYLHESMVFLYITSKSNDLREMVRLRQNAAMDCSLAIGQTIAGLV